MATNEDLEQRIAELESLVVSQYDPPSGPEYSFPQPGQPIDQDQFQLLSMANGNGVIDRDDYPYDLVGWGSDSETNQKNSMILKVGTRRSRAEALVSGYYHVLNEDKVVDLPPVLGDTTYFICLVFDPRVINEGGEVASGAVSVQVYESDPPLTFGRVPVILWSVDRKPNQLLTDSTIQRNRPRLAPPVYVWGENHKPDPASVLWGSLCIVGATNSIYRSAAESEVTSEGGADKREWVSITDPPWKDSSSSHYVWVGPNTPKPGFRVVGNRVELRGRVKRIDGTAFSPGTAYNVVPNSPVPDTGTTTNAGSDSKRDPLQVGRAAGGTLEVHVKNSASWVDLAGCFYYLR